jgi:hypothetical protein
VRKNLVAYLEKRIEGSDAWSKQHRDELVGELRQAPGLVRFLRRTNDHRQRIDKAAITKDAHFDGKSPHPDLGRHAQLDGPCARLQAALT